MNCKQCGAPVSTEEGRDFYHCAYCGSYGFPDPNLDGVALFDEVSPYACPVCGHPLVTAAVKDVHIYSCPNCRGNLISQSKMLPILRQAKAHPAAGEEQRLLQSPSERARTVICPACKKPMDGYPYGGSGNVIIQGCAECLLIWLDFGELSRIMHTYQPMKRRKPDDSDGAKEWGLF